MVTCPQCGTAGSRVHSRYQRTIADVAFGRRCLILKLLVRKWICPEASCSQRIFAERFPDLVQPYARMTDRLIEVLQSVGVTTNGADAARILSKLAMPTTAKTIIRLFRGNTHVLKTTSQQLAGKTLPVPTSPKAQRLEQISQRYHADRIIRHQLVWELFHTGHKKEEIARLTGISSRSVYRILSQQHPPTRLRRHHTQHLIDPYLSYLAQRWNEGEQKTTQLYEEIVAQGYTGSRRTLGRVLQQFRTSSPEKPISRQSVTLTKVFGDCA